MSETKIGQLLTKMEAAPAVGEKQKVYQYEDWTYLLDKYYDKKGNKTKLVHPKNNQNQAFDKSGNLVSEYNNATAEGYVIVT